MQEICKILEICNFPQKRQIWDFYIFTIFTYFLHFLSLVMRSTLSKWFSLFRTHVVWVYCSNLAYDVLKNWESIKAFRILQKSSLFIWTKMVVGVVRKVVIWLFASSLLASFSMGSTNDHWTNQLTDNLSSALLPIPIQSCPSSDIQMSQTEWNM